MATSSNDVCINADSRNVYSQIQLMKMSAKKFDDWEDEEEEEDFVPEDYDDEEGDDCVDDDEDEDDPEGFPSVLQGQFFMDRTKGLCYEQDGSFCLVCKTSIPGRTFPFEAPVIDSPLVFAGWINDPNRWMEFEVIFSKEQMSMDPLQIQLLEAQEQKQLSNGSSTIVTTGNDSMDDNWMEKKSPAKGNLKVPPSYSVKEKSDISIDNARKSSSKDFPIKSTAGDVIESNKGKMSHQNDMIFVVSGSQIGDDGIDGISISFRGSYRCLSKASVEKLYLICPIQTVDGSTSTSVAGGIAAVAAASTKRNRSSNDDGESVEGNIGVAYQELIDLHDDTRLSTDELRKRYYGSGDKKEERGKRHAPDNKRFKGTSNRGHHEKDVEDDDDDDAYGF